MKLLLISAWLSIGGANLIIADNAIWRFVSIICICIGIIELLDYTKDKK